MPTVTAPLLLVLLVVTTACPVHASLSRIPTMVGGHPPAQQHRAPCGPGQPDRLHISWRLSGREGWVLGSRQISRSNEVRALYRAICRQTLLKYSYKVTFFCPSYLSKMLYHLKFLSRRRTLLAVTEKAEGCFFLSIDGRPNLGISLVMFLPRGVPRPTGLPHSQVI